ncbi:MAG: sensor histidine kinase N-terminal domain-containing protein [Hyphomicrobiales bacterium]|nr:sensor histidine kinase N-terminal domain-containing protein [Hyphomicrobiales bacterium]
MDGPEVMSGSLRRVALLWTTILLTAVGLVTIFIAYIYARSEASEFLDGQLRQIALNAGAGVHAANAPRAADRDPEDAFAITIRDAAGQIVHQSLPPVTIGLQDRSGFSDVEANGRLWRVYTARSEVGAVQVAQQDTVRAEIADGAAMGAAAPIIVVIPLSWLVVGWALNRVLRPLGCLAAEIAARSASSTQAIALGDIPTEVRPLVESMNGLIDRSRAAVEAQKRFVADAAHELRTPLAAMQIEADNLASADAEGQRDRAAALVEGVKRASALANRLLQLARLDEPAPAAFRKIELGELLLDCVGETAPLAHRKGVDLGARVGAAAETRGAETEVRALLTVLIDNAVRYTPAGGKVDVSLDRRENRLLVEVLDTGPGLPAGSEARIFDRFYRGASRDSEGTGLGLAIARRIAERHGFDLIVENRGDGRSGARAQVLVPESGSPAPG